MPKHTVRLSDLPSAAGLALHTKDVVVSRPLET